MNKKEKILIIRLGAIGDVVHSTVIQQSIKEKYPDAEIHFLTSDTSASLIENDPNLKKVYRFYGEKSNNWLYLLQLGLQLRKERFDTIITLHNTIRTKFILFLANPKRIVYRSKNRVHAIDAFFNTAKEAFDDIERPKNLKLTLSTTTVAVIDNKISEYKRPFIVINPGGENNNSRQGRIWPLESWIDLSNKLVEEYGGTVFIVGSKNEKEYHKKLLKIVSAVLFSGELKIEESAALYSKADLFISGDSGPLHMASALGINTLGLMGSTPAVACGPYGIKCYSISADNGCTACGEKICRKLNEGIYTPCMIAITPNKVFDFIEDKKLLTRSDLFS